MFVRIEYRINASYDIIQIELHNIFLVLKHKIFLFFLSINTRLLTSTYFKTIYHLDIHNGPKKNKPQKRKPNEAPFRESRAFLLLCILTLLILGFAASPLSFPNFKREEERESSFLIINGAKAENPKGDQKPRSHQRSGQVLSLKDVP